MCVGGGGVARACMGVFEEGGSHADKEGEVSPNAGQPLGQPAGKVAVIIGVSSEDSSPETSGCACNVGGKAYRPHVSRDD